MHRASVLSFALLLGTSSADERGRSAVRGDAATELVFEGTVVDLAPIPAAHGSFRVTMTVDEVTHGAFSGARFEFALHSPARSGLSKGGRYTVHATRTDHGYVVDPRQWLPSAGRDGG